MIRLSTVLKRRRYYSQEVADKYIAAFREDVTALGVKPATRPRGRVLYGRYHPFVADLIEKKAMPYESQGMFISVWKKSHNYAKLANKTLEDLELGASGRTDEETAHGKIQSTLPLESCEAG